MKKAKRMFSAMLAVMLLAALLVIPASAEGETYTVTIESDVEGHTYEIYQIFSGTLNTNDVLTNICWGTGVNTDGQNALGDAVAVAGALKTPEDVRTFGNKVAPYLTNPAGTDDYADNEYKFTGLSAGYYLVKDDDTQLGVNDAYTKYIIQVVGNVRMAPKVGVPTLEKMVSRTAEGGYNQAISAATGNTVYFSLTASMHTQIGNYDQYYLKFTDVLPAGLTYEGVQSVYVTSENDPNQKDAVPVQYYKEIEKTTGADEKTTVVIEVDEAKAAILAATHAEAMADDKIVVVIKATLKNSATIGGEGNTNTATLEYTNDPNDAENYKTNLGQTTPSQATVYTYELQMTKVDAVVNTKLLAGAQFVLYHYKNSTEIVYLIIDNDGYVTGTTGDPNQATVLTTGEDGTINVKGIHSGTYYLKEKAAPDGYNLRVEDVAVSIAGTLNAATGRLDTFSASANPVVGAATATISTGLVEITIDNRPGTALPETGGIGTTIFYVVGAVLVIGAATILVSKKRKPQE